MVGTIFWVITLGYNIAALIVWTRTFKRFNARLLDVQKDISQLKDGVHKAINNSADNRMDIVAMQADIKSNWNKMRTIQLGVEEDCKSRHTEAIEMYNGRLNYALNKWDKKFEELQTPAPKKRGRLKKKEEA